MKKIIRIFVASVALFFSNPQLNFGQAPNLGTAANFALFTTVGEVLNVGTPQLTHITGNVGSNVGPITGFGNVNGQLHAGNAQSAQCATDLLIAYGELAAAIPTFSPAPILGNGDVLIPGVYFISAASSLNLDLTLDAEGDPNAVFIFQIQGAFSVNANANVSLINGAQACNVFWKVEGLVSIAINVTMRGTIIANNAAISLGAGNILEGRALAINGAVSVTETKVYTPAGCGAPILSGPEAPDLTSIACFTIFSSIGPVTNVGITNITGDVGTNSGLTTGFDPLLVIGEIHPIPDESTQQAAADLLVIYNTLIALPYDIELLRPDLFGHNLVITPHTYVMNGETSLTDSVYLDAQGNDDAVFIIKIFGAFSTSNYSKVILMNGQQSKNVFWLVSGAIEITDYSEFVGTIICNNGAIDIGTGVNIDGRALTTNGAITTTAITAVMPPGCDDPVLQPFYVNVTQNIGTSAMLDWPTVSGAVSYIVHFREANTNNSWKQGFTNTNSRRLTNLVPGQNYEVRILVYGTGNTYLTYYHMYYFTAAVIDIVATQNMGTALLLSWNDIEGFDQYIVQYRQSTAASWKISAFTNTNSIRLSQLVPGEDYECRVLGYANGVYGGFASDNFTSANIQFEVVENTGVSAKITWIDQVPDANRFVLHYRIAGSLGNWLHANTLTDSRLLVNLLPNTTYEYRLLGYFNNIYGGVSPIHEFTTIGGKSNTNTLVTEQNFEMNVYPNPFVDIITVEIFTSTEETVLYTMYDITGKVIMSGKEIINTGYNTLTVQTEYLSAGIYILNVVTDNETHTFRVVK